MRLCKISTENKNLANQLYKTFENDKTEWVGLNVHSLVSNLRAWFFHISCQTPERDSHYLQVTIELLTSVAWNNSKMLLMPGCCSIASLTDRLKKPCVFTSKKLLIAKLLFATMFCCCCSFFCYFTNKWLKTQKLERNLYITMSVWTYIHGVNYHLGRFSTIVEQLLYKSRSYDFIGNTSYTQQRKIFFTTNVVEILHWL